MKNTIILSVVLTLTFGTAARSVLIIDDFEVGEFGTFDNTTGDGPGPPLTLTGLDTSHVLSGNRSIEINLESGIEANALLLIGAGTEDSVECIDASGSDGLYSFQYTYSPSQDFTGGGQDRFLVTLGSGTPNGGNLQIDVENAGIVFSFQQDNHGPGIYTVPYQSFIDLGADLTSVDEIGLFLDPPLAGGSSQTFYLSDFRTAPEPATLALLLLGGLALLRRRR